MATMALTVSFPVSKQPLASPDQTAATSEEYTSEDHDVPLLDELLAKYLHILDRYTVLRAELARDLADGFLSLARARSTASPATLHFGIDSSSLGSRARAARLRARIVDNAGPAAAAAVASRPPQKISPAIESETLRLEIRTVPPQAPRQKTANETFATKSQEEKITPVQSTGVEKNRSNIQSMLDGSLEPAKDHESTDSDTDTAPDPLRLFGLFPPSALRHVQRSFEHAVVSPVAELVRVMAEMRRLEDVIQREMAERGT